LLYPPYQYLHCHAAGDGDPRFINLEQDRTAAIGEHFDVFSNPQAHVFQPDAFLRALRWKAALTVIIISAAATFTAAAAPLKGRDSYFRDFTSLSGA